MEERISQFIPDNITQAICHTLVHSLWQGIILALIAGLIVALTKKSAAVVRYHWLAGALVMFAAAFFCTLLIELQSKTVNTFQITGSATSSQAGIWDGLWNNLNFGLKYAHEHAGAVVIIWVLFLCVKSARLIFGLYIIKRLKTVKIKRMPPFWEERLKQLSAALNIKQTVILLESGIAKIPLVIGYLKPVILIPAGLINSMGQDEVEAILLHELAHIRRGDYLVNLLQSIIETLLFFNPAVLWLSHLLKVERENCCDDAVLNQTNNKIGYVQALVQFHEHCMNIPQHALAFGGKSKEMVRRMERMVNSRNRGLNRPEVITLSIIIFFSALFVVARPVNSIHSLATKQPAAATSKGDNRAFEAKKKAEAAERTKKPGTSP